MSTPRGPHKPICPESFEQRVQLWSNLVKKADFVTESFEKAMNKPQCGDLVYCDPPYTHSQSIIYGAQTFGSYGIKLLNVKIEGSMSCYLLTGQENPREKIFL